MIITVHSNQPCFLGNLICAPIKNVDGRRRVIRLAIREGVSGTDLAEELKSQGKEVPEELKTNSRLYAKKLMVWK